MRHIGLTVILFLSLAVFANGETISLWNFNDAISGTTGGSQEFLVDYGSGTMTSTFGWKYIGNSSGSTLNSRPDDPAGRALNLRGHANNGSNLTWLVDTTGFSTIEVSFATRRTNTGFNNNHFLFSTNNGVSWTDFGSPYLPDTGFGLQSFDLSEILELDNNFRAGFRIVFDGATSSLGNNRIDNLVVSGNPVAPQPTVPVPEPSTAILLVLGLCGVFFIQRK